MNLARPFAALLIVIALSSCDATHDVVYTPEDLSGRWLGTGVYQKRGSYDAHLVFRQSGDRVFADGTVTLTDSLGQVAQHPYDLEATYANRTLNFQSGFGVATVSEDGRTLHWLYGDGDAAYDLQRK
ncbi:MAG TPA: hypothetical protein VD948_09275 [Rhodothermales bacterium]|nr:hypothetical protein [Rhodothermales bacterium]